MAYRVAAIHVGRHAIYRSVIEVYVLFYWCRLYLVLKGIENIEIIIDDSKRGLCSRGTRISEDIDTVDRTIAFI